MRNWKSVKIPRELWTIIRTRAAQKGIKMYEEIGESYQVAAISAETTKNDDVPELLQLQE